MEEAPGLTDVQKLLDSLLEAFSADSEPRWWILIKAKRISPEGVQFAVNKIDTILATMDELEARL